MAAVPVCVHSGGGLHACRHWNLLCGRGVCSACTSNEQWTHNDLFQFGFSELKLQHETGKTWANFFFVIFICYFQTLWWLVWITTIALCWQPSAGMSGKNQLCEVDSGQTNIILDIEESRGNSKCNSLDNLYREIEDNEFTQRILCD